MSQKHEERRGRLNERLTHVQMLNALSAEIIEAQEILGPPFGETIVRAARRAVLERAALQGLINRLCAQLEVDSPDSLLSAAQQAMVSTRELDVLREVVEKVRARLDFSLDESLEMGAERLAAPRDHLIVKTKSTDPVAWADRMMSEHQAISEALAERNREIAKARKTLDVAFAGSLEEAVEAVMSRLAGLEAEAAAPSAAQTALDAIAGLCGCKEWEYPGQVVRDVEILAKAREDLSQGGHFPKSWFKEAAKVLQMREDEKLHQAARRVAGDLEACKQAAIVLETLSREHDMPASPIRFVDAFNQKMSEAAKAIEERDALLKERQAMRELQAPPKGARNT